MPAPESKSAQGWRTSSLTSSTTLSRLKRAKVEIKGLTKPVGMWKWVEIRVERRAWAVFWGTGEEWVSSGFDL